jgi:MinD superfamily P-loop ATPase
LEADMINGHVDSRARLVPIIDPERCNGCGLCARVCPTTALAIQRGHATVTRPAACAYTGLCELICPTQAIQRPFVIVLAEGTQAPRANQATERN